MDMTIDEIMTGVGKYNCELVEITGGEPLVQENVYILMQRLCDLDYKVMIETGGSLPVNSIDKRVKIIMDLKTPSSNMSDKNLFENISYLKPKDEIKFVIGDRDDYDWAKEIILKYNLCKKVKVLMSPVFEVTQNIDLASWILNDGLKVRFQIQLHKYIWHPETRGV
jgi:7-carboxy-7-deazaguanine synthase